MTNPTIETDSAEIRKEIKSDQKAILKEISELKREIKSDQKAISDEISNLRVGQTRLEERVKNIDDTVKEIKTTQKNLVSDVADLKGAKSLIIPIFVAVTASILTLVFRAIPLN